MNNLFDKTPEELKEYFQEQRERELKEMLEDECGRPAEIEFYEFELEADEIKQQNKEIEKYVRSSGGIDG